MTVVVVVVHASIIIWIVVITVTIGAARVVDNVLEVVHDAECAIGACAIDLDGENRQGLEFGCDLDRVSEAGR